MAKKEKVKKYATNTKWGINNGNSMKKEIREGIRKEASGEVDENIEDIGEDYAFKLEPEVETGDEKPEEKVKKKDIPLEVYKTANLMFKCHSCGHSYVMEEGISGGVRFDIYATNKHKLVLACPRCKAVMEMYFEKGKEALLVDMDGAPITHIPEPTSKVNTIDPPVERTEKEKLTEDKPEVVEVETLPEEVIADIEKSNNEDTVQEENKQEASV